MGYILYWHKQDLRIHHNPILVEALKQNLPILPLYIHDHTRKWPHQGASLWWLQHSLVALAEMYAKYNASLIFRQGNTLQILQNLHKEHPFQALYTQEAIDREDREIETELQLFCQNHNIQLKRFPANLAYPITEIYNKEGKPFKVFGHFWKHVTTTYQPKIIKQIIDRPILQPTPLPLSEPLTAPTPHWAKAFSKLWSVGEKAAEVRLQDFISHHLASYTQNRNYPALQATSYLSPHLHFGEISPGYIIDMLATHPNSQTFLREIGWREFSYYLLYHYPNLPEDNWRDSFNNWPWQNDKAHIRAWQKGLTGYPIIDAGMRELWQTGWMHNRVRMIVASFLVKHLLIDWRIGEFWFWDTLIDADLANNATNWQWVAGSGTDAAPYFRIFNPVLQSEKFDAYGEYIRMFVPELKRLPAPYIHKPWQASPTLLTELGIVLGKTYPYPIIDHNKARNRALAIYQSIRNSKKLLSL